MQLALLVSPSAGSAAVAVGERLDGVDVEEGDPRPTIGVGEGDEEAAAHDDGQVGMTDLIRVTTAEPHAKRLEGVAVEHFAQFFDSHAGSTASDFHTDNRHQRSGETATFIR